MARAFWFRLRAHLPNLFLRFIIVVAGSSSLVVIMVATGAAAAAIGSWFMEVHGMVVNETNGTCRSRGERIPTFDLYWPFGGKINKWRETLSIALLTLLYCTHVDYRQAKYNL